MKNFECKSVRLKNYLVKNGLKYTWVSVDPSDNMTYWVFVRDDRFNGYFFMYNSLNKKLNNVKIVRSDTYVQI